MTVVLVHGIPETTQIWRPLVAVLRRDHVAIALPGFATPWPERFTGTKDAYASWLAETLAGLPSPLDIVGHDIGALLTLRVVIACDLAVRSWVVDVANVFHPEFRWPERVRAFQTPEVGEHMLDAATQVARDDPRSPISRLISGGVPAELAIEIGSAYTTN